MLGKLFSVTSVIADEGLRTKMSCACIKLYVSKLNNFPIIKIAMSLYDIIDGSY